MHYLITGSSGQLARAFQARFEALGADYAAPPEADLDITDAEAVRSGLDALKPDIVLNCAAYNDVERAETAPAPAFAVNELGVKNLAEACADSAIRLVHYGTDYIFDGAKEGLYTEDDTPNPLNQYGASKLAGEKVVLAGSQCQRRAGRNTQPAIDIPQPSPHALLLRTSWVFGNGTQNFFHKLVQWSRTRDVMKVVWDQISVPTYTEDIVTYTLKALDVGLYGTFHLTNTGYASRYETARHFFKLAGIDMIVLPVASSYFGDSVNRPFFSAMSNRTLADALGTDIPAWQDAVTRYVKGSEQWE